MWTPIKPTVDGFYWFQALNYEPWIVEIRDGDLYEDGVLIDWPLSDVKFFGPIEPPEVTNE
jgi:hypothetical protein